MKVLLVVGGVLFLLLGFVLLVIALIVWLVGRNRRPAAGVPVQQPMPQAVPQPMPQPVQQPPMQAAPMPPPPPPQAASFAPPPPPKFTPPPSAPIVPDESKTMAVGVGGFGALHGLSGPVMGRVFPLDPKGFYIGRDRTMADVVIEDPSVSKRHVWIGVRDGSVVAVDQSSTNGTYLNTIGNRITEARLAPGDTLIISDDVARFAFRV